MKRMVIVSVLAATAFACASGGGGRGATIGERQQQQRRSIEQGVRQGDLTRNEASVLGGAVLQSEYDRRKALEDDGRIDQGERQQIKKQQRKAGKALKSNRNDAQRRP